MVDKKKFSINIPTALVADIDQYAAAHYQNRTQALIVLLFAGLKAEKAKKRGAEG